MSRLSFDQSEHPQRPRSGPGPARPQAWSLVLAIGLFAAGCDTFTFSPPRPPELTAKTKALRTAAGDVVNAPSTKTIEVVLTPRSKDDVEMLKAAVRLQAGIDKLRLQVDAPAEGAAAAEQAELVRKSIARKPPVILIEAPADPGAELIQAVAEARKAGVAVVSLGRPLTASDASASAPADGSAAPMVVVVHESLNNSAATLVADAMRSAKNGEIATDSGAVILVDPSVDSLVQDRVAALRKALEAAGVKRVDELKFERTIEDGKNKLVKYLEAHPDTTLVFGVDATGVLAADEATGVLKEKHRYAIAGYTGEDAARNQVMMNEYAAIGVLSIDRLLRRGVNVAGGILNGDQVPPKDVLMIPILEASAKAGLPRMKIDPPDKPQLPKDAATPLKK